MTDNVELYDPQISYKQKDLLYENVGGGRFRDVSAQSGPAFQIKHVGRGAAIGDFDNDGDLDIVIADCGGPALLFRNDGGNRNHWIAVRARGRESNRFGIGAKVRVKAFYRGASRSQLRQITGGSGWANGNNELQAHFGPGDAANADTVRIEWPSGTVQEFYNVAPRQTLTYTEPPRLLAIATNGVPQFALKGGRFMQYDIQASTDLAAWSSVGTVTITNMSGTAQIVDTNAPYSTRGFYRAVSR